jgi:hypothetical protein
MCKGRKKLGEGGKVRGKCQRDDRWVELMVKGLG